MMTDIGPIRTALFVPGNRPDRVDKAVKTDADAIILDLEDAVALSEKEAARTDVANKVLEHSGHKVIVRINGLDSPFFREDLRAVVKEGLTGVMVPKVDDAEQIRIIHERLLQAEQENAVEAGTLSILPLIESALAVQNVFHILAEPSAHSRIYCLAFGAADFTLDMGVEITQAGSELLYARSRMAVASRAGRIHPPLDTPFMMDLRDIAALEVDARRAKQLGFQGKLCIHPNQIAPCNRVFSPTTEEIRHAESIVKAFHDAESKGVASFQVNNRFIDYAVLEKSKRILEISKMMSR